MQEKTVSVNYVTAIGLWAATFLLIFSGTVVALLDGGAHLGISIGLMAHGLACSAAAATMSIRCMLKKQNQLLKDAFTLGQDSASNGVPVRRLH